MKSTRIALAVAALACSLSLPAAAAPITLTATLDGLLSNTQQGRFTLGNGFNGGNYKIDSLTFSFNFSDDGDRVLYGDAALDHSDIGAYAKSAADRSVPDTANPGRTVLMRYFSRDVTHHYNVLGMGEQESAVLSLGGIVVGSNGTTMSETSSSATVGPVPTAQDAKFIAGVKTGCDSNGNNCTGWQPGQWQFYTDNVSTTTTTTTQSWTGDFDISGTTTNRDIIDQLLNNKFLDFGLDLTGDLFLRGAQISFDLVEVEAEVPEPSSVLLMLAALGGLGYSMRRRGAKQ